MTKKTVAADNVEAKIRRKPYRMSKKDVEDLKRLADYKPDEDIARLFSLSIDSFLEDLEKQKKETVIAMFLTKAVSDDITFRQVCERYYIKEIPETDNRLDVKYYRDDNGRLLLKRHEENHAERIGYECRIKLVKREKPIMLDKIAYEDFQMDAINYLCKKLKI